MRESFFGHDKAVLTVMVQAHTPERVKELIDKALPNGAEAFGIQLEQMNADKRTKEIYKDLFAYSGDKPVYVTYYRGALNEGKADEELAEGMLEIADCGADLCDVMGDLFDKRDDELAVNEEAIKKQIDLIDKLHAKGAKVLMSSHVYKYTPMDRVVEMALEHQRRGADICKIVTGAENFYEEAENLKIIQKLKETLDIPFLFLCTNVSGVMRRIGGELGCCMYLCVQEHDELATPVQPLLTDVKLIRDGFDSLRRQQLL